MKTWTLWLMCNIQKANRLVIPTLRTKNRKIQKDMHINADVFKLLTYDEFKVNLFLPNLGTYFWDPILCIQL